MVVYDITDKSSFEAVAKWLEDIDEVINELKSSLHLNQAPYKPRIRIKNLLSALFTFGATLVGRI